MAQHLKRSNHRILIGNDAIAYELVRSKKRRRSIALKITPALKVQINCPYLMPMVDIESFIISRYDWIQRQLADMAQRPAVPQLQYHSGEQHWLRGKPLTLEVISGKKNEILIKNDTLYVFHRPNSQVKKLIKQWYREQALSHLTHRTLHLAQRHGFDQLKDINVRYMKARWGSCSNAGNIMFNVHLIKAADALIDYVIIHELCHLIHHNHGRGFYQLQTALNPQWQHHKRSLDQLSIIAA